MSVPITGFTAEKYNNLLSQISNSLSKFKDSDSLKNIKNTPDDIINDIRDTIGFVTKEGNIDSIYSDFIDLKKDGMSIKDKLDKIKKQFTDENENIKNLNDNDDISFITDELNDAIDELQDLILSHKLPQQGGKKSKKKKTAKKSKKGKKSKSKKAKKSKTKKSKSKKNKKTKKRRRRR